MEPHTFTLLEQIRAQITLYKKGDKGEPGNKNCEVYKIIQVVYIVMTYLVSYLSMVAREWYTCWCIYLELSGMRRFYLRNGEMGLLLIRKNQVITGALRYTKCCRESVL